jgi:oligopeptide/dipeptide ABC transporter ATP-binding protein
LDVSIQAQILNLLQDLQEQFDLTFLFIAHDLSVVKHISDIVAVMYLGKIVEMVQKEQLYSNPQHPYTDALLSAIPLVNPMEEKKRIILQGSVPSPIKPPPGCRFHTRCPSVMDICSKEEPEMIDLGGEHFCACHLRTGGKKEAVSA